MKHINHILALLSTAVLMAANLTSLSAQAMAMLSDEDKEVLISRMRLAPCTVENEVFQYTAGSVMEMETDLMDLSQGDYFMVSGLLCELPDAPDQVTNICVAPIKTSATGFTTQRGILWNAPEGLDLSSVQIGDIYHVVETDGSVSMVPEEFSHSKVERVGAGEEIFGSEFRKVIRHEFLSVRGVVTAGDPETASFDFISGDISENDDVDIIDVIALNQYLLGSCYMSCYQALTADVDQSGTLNATDSLMILKEVVGLTENYVEVTE